MADERRRRSGAGDSGGDGGAVELSLRLRTGSGSSSSAAAAAATVEEAARRRRSMTIFYNGRVCAVDVTDIQARAIITMANQEILSEQQQQQQRVESVVDRDRQQQDCGGGSTTTAAARPEPPTMQRRAAAAAAGHALSPAPPRQDFDQAAAAPVAPTISHAVAAGLSMKRSLQRFLQKRKTRAAAVGSPYDGGRRPAQPTRHSAMPS